MNAFSANAEGITQSRKNDTPNIIYLALHEIVQETLRTLLDWARTANGSYAPLSQVLIHAAFHHQCCCEGSRDMCDDLVARTCLCTYLSMLRECFVIHTVI